MGTASRRRRRRGGGFRSPFRRVQPQRIGDQRRAAPKCPVAWNENYGGFWFLTSYDAVSQTARDGDTFAHKYEPDAADGVDYQGEMGVPRPEGQPALGIGEVDGPTTRR